MSSLGLLILVGVTLLVVLLFVGLVWLFVWISRNNPNAPRPPQVAAPRPGTPPGPRESAEAQEPNPAQPGMNRAARRRQGRD
ncbi:hypothetical protein [Deinococcus sp.]|uniref:hypothetical protein n=1 Tax=Deinococcus sp. TaxID=47478 RepID=UPI003C7BC0DE